MTEGRGSRPSVSIVVCTLNRAASLRGTLRALRHVDYAPFEVVVVNGPSTDGTADVLREHEGRIKVGQCPVANLSMSRNVGIALAAGDIVAFLDDDAYPEPGWLDAIVGGFAGLDVAGVGGPVFDHTGVTLQARYSLANRLGHAWISDGPNPTAWLGAPFGFEFVYPIGTNAAFRRDRLVEIGGFDEVYEYYLDETDVTLRLLDRGFQVRALDEGFVYHKFLPSHVRNPSRVVTHRFPVLKNRAYFAHRHATAHRSAAEISADLDAFVDLHRRDVLFHVALGNLAATDVERFERDVERAHAAASRQLAQPPATHPAQWFAERQGPFLAYPTVQPAAGALHVCLVTAEYVPQQLNGIARVLHTLATELGAQGHVVRVITQAADHPDVQSTVDLEGDVWVHRVKPVAHPVPADLVVPAHVWRWPATAFDEIRRIDALRPVDVVQVPNWAAEGAAVLYDGRFPTVVGLYTPMLTVAELDHRVDPRTPEVAAMIDLERRGYSWASAALACGPSIVNEIEGRYGVHFERLGQVAHGLPESAAEPVEHPEAPVVLFVGRLEPRKGIDTLLDALPGVLRCHPRATVVVAGHDGIAAPDGRTYRQRFEDDPAVRDVVGRVTFTGLVDETELDRLYAECDVFVAPSRYESFGLILLEAMRVGKPVIAGDVGGMTEIVSEGETGLLVPPGDALALAGALDTLLASPERRAEMGRRARKSFDERYAATRMAEGVAAFYRQVVDEASRAASEDMAEALPPDQTLATLVCPRCRGSLSLQPRVICADGRTKEGALVCERCRVLAASIDDFRIDFHRAGEPVPAPVSEVLARPVLGEWRLVPGGREAPAFGTWTWSPPLLSSAGALGDRITFSARCTDVLVRCQHSPWSGRLAVSVDGVRTATLDLFEPEGSWVQAHVLLADAPDVMHEVDLVVLGEHHPDARGAQVHVEELIVKGPLEAGRPFHPPAPINRGNPYSEAMLAHLDRLPPGSTVLEIGGGDRRRAVPGHVNFEYLPFELADMYGDSHALPFADDAFAMVCSQAVFEHVSRPFEAAGELVRITRPGGTIFTEAAFLQPLHAVPHHYFNMTLAGLRELFAGCEVTDEGWFGPLSETVDWLLRAAGLPGKVASHKLDAVVAAVRELDRHIDHEALQAVASGVYLAVRKPAP